MRIYYILGIVIFILIIGFLYFRTKNNSVLDDVKPIENKNINTNKKETNVIEDIANSKIRNILSIISKNYVSKLPIISWYDKKSKHSELPLTGGELFVLSILLGIVAFLIALVLTRWNLFKSIGSGVVGFAFIGAYINNLANKRDSLFQKQLGEAITMMQNALKAGFTFPQAMQVVADEMKPPISSEFKKAIVEMQLGLTVEEALTNVSSRVDNDDFDLLVTAVLIQRQVGGNLTQIMETIGSTIRERMRLKDEIKTLTAEGVMSGWVLALMPIGLSLVLNWMRPGYFDGMLNSSYGQYIVAGCLISEIIGGLVIKKLVNLKV